MNEAGEVLDASGAASDREVCAEMLGYFQTVRAATSELVRGLSAEDQMVQSCPEASPVKWHLAHTTWFFETFVLQECVAGYSAFSAELRWLFNSYYQSLGRVPDRRLRATLSRPSLDTVLSYREHVNQQVERQLQIGLPERGVEVLLLGIEHEQQHQELIATDIKHAFFSNPLRPVFAEGAATPEPHPPLGLGWIDNPGGLLEIGAPGDGFAFDNELPRHRVHLNPFRLASRPVTCGEYLSFIHDGAYARPELWLSAGWEAVNAQGWEAPLYWEPDSEGGWKMFTLGGWRPVQKMSGTPVCHVSFFEADAYARWAGCRLPTEGEWEATARAQRVTGNLLESKRFHPRTCFASTAPQKIYGDVWEWTASPYVGYPGFRAAGGALGEYNGKFMSDQWVLRGGSTVTPRRHIRASYRNFFPATARWQFSGIRLAADESTQP